MPAAVLALHLGGEPRKQQAVGEQMHEVLVQEDGGDPALGSLQYTASAGRA